MSNPAGSYIGEKTHIVKALFVELLAAVRDCIDMSHWSSQLDHNFREVPDKQWTELREAYMKIKKVLEQ